MKRAGLWRAGVGALGPRLLVSVLITLVLLGGTIALWPVATGVAPAEYFSGPAAKVALFAVAGCLGGVLRSQAYLLAYRNLNPREQLQWSLEAVVGPVLGTAAGIGAYFLVVSAVVAKPNDVNVSGQYLLSLLAGAAALSQFGRMAERGVLRGGLSRSGILGAEPSATAPLLERLDTVVSQRLVDLSVFNYSGVVRASAERAEPDSDSWLVSVEFTGEGKAPGEQSPRSDPQTPARPNAASTGRIEVRGGEQREYVPFNLAVLSEHYDVSPLSLAAYAPALGSSGPCQFVLEGDLTEMKADGESLAAAVRAPRRPFVVLEVSQGSQTVQVVRVPLVEGAAKGEVPNINHPGKHTT